jgi:hypothetical protein
MRRQELGIEQPVTAKAEARDEMDERDLACVGDPAEHAFAEEGGAERDAIETADPLALCPALDTLRSAERPDRARPRARGPGCRAGFLRTA